ncbi:MAG: restriction endonuclease subunit S, partial [Schleiferiaceae bacterium]|nr:restriction endonuclease subunit S [Schleiferiaceae bacterium]
MTNSTKTTDHPIAKKPGYKKTKLGWIPAEWEVTRLGTVVKVQGGNAFKSSTFCDFGIPLIRIANIKNGRVQVDEVHVPYDSKLERFILKKGDLIIAMSGATTGKIGVYELDFPSYLNQRVGRFIPKRVDHTFLRYLISTNRFKHDILVDAIGGAQPNISGSDIESMYFPLPPL